MSTYNKCPSCGNKNNGDEVYKCQNCANLFCTKCGVTRFGDFCPSCESKNNSQAGTLQGKISS